MTSQAQASSVREASPVQHAAPAAPVHLLRPAPRGLRRTGRVRIPVAILAAAFAWLPMAAVPAAAQSGAPCADINNTTGYSWPIRMQIGDGAPQQMRIEKQTFGRFCMRDIPSTAELTVSVRSTWVPVGECTFPPGGLVTITRRPNSDGDERTYVTCAPPAN